MTTDAPATAPPTQAPPAPSPQAQPLGALPDLSGRPDGVVGASPLGPLGMLADIEIELTVEFGRRRLPLSQVAGLEVGSVIELDSLAGEPLVIYANGRRIASGDAVVVDGQFGIRIQRMG
ncbi:FliM/FliN family flagellar motor switch protein [Rubrivirga sp. IMCC43871]|uniref:FliM/FliN family flagellar motor switch protein n=1 Tax=Rubrivirga sp. IMCC43871 TaxID=3391575 RepID=UPI00398FB8BB